MLSRQLILNLFLFVIVISLASIIYFSEEENTQLQRLTGIDINSITSITIRHNEITTKIIKQQEKQWQITQPVSVAVNNFRINALLKLINAPVHSQYSLNEVYVSNIGLDHPDTIIKLNNQMIAFGTINPATNLRYIKLNNFVYTIVDVYYPLLTSHFATLVSPDLLPVNSTIEKLILVNQTISKDDKGFWQSNIDISADHINKTIDHWQHNQAFGVHKYSPSDKDNLGEVFAYLKDRQQPVHFLITDIDPWLIMARPEIGLEYHLDIEAYDKLIKPQTTETGTLSN